MRQPREAEAACAAFDPGSPAAATARAGLYRLLGRLYLQEIDRPTLALLSSAPPFAGPLAGAAGNEEALLAHLRSEYARLFLMNVYPYESVYADESVMLNTETTAAVAEAYAEAGFTLDGLPRPGAPDHIGAELTFVAALAEQEAGALASLPGRGAERLWQARQRAFLAAHLASWGPAFALAAARDARHPFYRVLAELTAEFVLADLEHLAGAESAAGPATTSRHRSGAGRPAIRAGAGKTAELASRPKPDDREIPSASGVGVAGAPEPADPATAPAAAGREAFAGEVAAGLPESELAEVTRHLATPVLSGLHLSREELYRLAGRLRLPVSMLDRPKMIEMLFEAAARFGQLPALLALLEAGAAEAARRYEQWATAYPSSAPVLAPWRRRAAATAASLAAMRRTAGHAS